MGKKHYIISSFIIFAFTLVILITVPRVMSNNNVSNVTAWEYGELSVSSSVHDAIYIWQTSQVTYEAGSNEQFSELIGVKVDGFFPILDYLGSQGWELIIFTPASPEDNDLYENYIFKRKK